MNTKKSFWSTLPGILAGIAGIITAVGGLLVILYQTEVIGPKQKPEPSEVEQVSRLSPPFDQSQGQAGQRQQENHIEKILQEIKDFPVNGDPVTRELLELEFRESMAEQLKKRDLDPALNSLDLLRLEKVAREHGIIR